MTWFRRRNGIRSGVMVVPKRCRHVAWNIFCCSLQAKLELSDEVIINQGTDEVQSSRLTRSNVTKI